MLLKDIIAKVPEMAQRQDSVTEQMHDLLAVATRLGMYDARDWVRDAFFREPHKKNNGRSLD